MTRRGVETAMPFVFAMGLVGWKERKILLGRIEEAVTARIHGLIVATRNDADFASLDVPVVNPFRGDGCWARVWQRRVPRVIDQRHGGK